MTGESLEYLTYKSKDLLKLIIAIRRYGDLNLIMSIVSPPGQEARGWGLLLNDKRVNYLELNDCKTEFRR